MGNRKGGRIKSDKEQMCVNMQNQFSVKGKDGDAFTEISSAINNLSLGDLSQSHVAAQEITQLRIVRNKKVVLVRKNVPNGEQLELIIQEIELINKKSKKVIESFNSKCL